MKNNTHNYPRTLNFVEELYRYIHIVITLKTALLSFQQNSAHELC